MEMVVNTKQISHEEKAQISRQVKAELIEHLYQGCLPGTIAGIPIGIVIFVDFYKYTSTFALITWLIVYNLALLTLTGLFFYYKKNKQQFSLKTWLIAYSTVMSFCALLWGICILALFPDTVSRQYLAFAAIFMISTGYATGTIGEFFLSVITLTIIVGSLIIWCFLKGTSTYYMIGAFAMIYLFFLYGINHRSTQWLIDSLKLKLENTLVSYQANHDILTDLPNQRLLPQSIDATINASKNTGNIFALACFSLNRMEMINDSLGHQAGNEIIKAVASRLKNLAAQTNTANEIGTQFAITISRKDTFNIIVAPLKTENAESQIKLLFSVLDDPFYLEQKGIKLTASIGVSLFGKDGQDAQSMMINADAAMLQAKQFGGNRLEFYRTEINAAIPRQLALETDLHNAVKDNQLVVYYQPLIHLISGQISGMEALVRWKHPVHGLVSPAHFIPLAEETGLIIPIGEWVMEEACKQTKKWHEMGFSSLKIAVNLAEKQLRQNNIIPTIERILKTTRLDTQYLELEITETAILDETIINLIAQFKNMGLSLSVDDFGTGYSGLSYLKRFSIDKLKIDQSFVRDLPANNDSMTIVSAIIAMAKELKVKTLAEGVETAEQLQFLIDKGCDFVQGYYFSKPLETDSFTQLLQNYRGFTTKPKEII